MARKVDVAIIGAGSAGVTALYTLLRAKKSVVLINSGPEGTTCARVGCMPSKALIETASLYHNRGRQEMFGLRGTEHLSVDGPAVMARVRAIRDQLVGGFITRTHKHLDETQFIDGHAKILAPDCVEVNGEKITCDAILIATGSAPILPPPFRALGDALLTTDTLFEEPDLPKSLAVVGLGVIGCEIGQAMGRLGVEVHGFDAAPVIAGIKDPVVAEAAAEWLGRDMAITTGTLVEPRREADGSVTIQAGEKSVTVERVLASIGRRPNIDGLGLENLGVALDDHGMPAYDPETLQIGDLPVYFTGDVNADRPLLHEAKDEGKIAALNIIAGTRTAFRRRVPLGVAFTAPQIATVGAGFDTLDPEVTAVGKASAQNNGRSKVKAELAGMIRIYADKSSLKLLGATLAISDGEHMAHWLALAIEQGMTIDACLETPFYHPVLEETLQDALMDCLANSGHKLPHPPGLTPV
ncbi:dihydrolipoyl dehydrogenase [Celeribacter neptunius]|uniref:Dihydrolipoamide dehydrogenase n=1 Tax=Celeribacter neptunius TaxID=588602 RepID=A0A1I3VPW6_9RHOB|nr:dihydrolipoyl dehydrogenase [Celeribacter neptunius]SFJ97169.1 dihydrolipoamide dehydrogenase [Celeribacter neptunius]